MVLHVAWKFFIGFKSTFLKAAVALSVPAAER